MALIVNATHIWYFKINRIGQVICETFALKTFFNVRTSTKLMLHFCFLNAFIKHPLGLLLYSAVWPSNLKMAVADHLYRLLSRKLKSTAISSPKASYTTHKDDCASDSEAEQYKDDKTKEKSEVHEIIFVGLRKN